MFGLFLFHQMSHIKPQKWWINRAKVTKVNLIEYNPIDDGEFQQASSRAIDNYISNLEMHDIVVNVRRSRGKDIDAACGQLANKS